MLLGARPAAAPDRAAADAAVSACREAAGIGRRAGGSSRPITRRASVIQRPRWLAAGAAIEPRADAFVEATAPPDAAPCNGARCVVEFAAGRRRSITGRHFVIDPSRDIASRSDVGDSETAAGRTSRSTSVGSSISRTELICSAVTPSSTARLPSRTSWSERFGPSDRLSTICRWPERVPTAPFMRRTHQRIAMMANQMTTRTRPNRRIRFIQSVTL